jgi:hypothetical protein
MVRSNSPRPSSAAAALPTLFGLPRLWLLLPLGLLQPLGSVQFLGLLRHLDYRRLPRNLTHPLAPDIHPSITHAIVGKAPRITAGPIAPPHHRRHRPTASRQGQ